MKYAKLACGILSIVFTFIILFQSCSVGLYNTFATEASDSSGFFGVFVAILLLTGAIVMIATRKSKSIGAGITGVILFGLAFIIGKNNYGIYEDLEIWAYWALIMAILNLIPMFFRKKSKGAAKEEKAEPVSETDT